MMTEINEVWPQNELERVSHCPVCGSPGRELLYTGLTDRVFFCAPGKWDLYRCLDCESAFLDPRPTQNSIGKAYSAYFTHEQDEVARNFLNILNIIKIKVKNGYLNVVHGTNFSPAWVSAGRLLKMIPLPYKIATERILRFLPKVRGVLVDIGCGNGNIICIAKELGWETWGIDPDPKAVEVAKSTGAKVFQSNLPDTGLPSDYFDVVILNHVIEHLHDPIASLKEIYRILKPGGMIWVATPNLKSEGLRRFHSNWLHLDSPRHLVLFTPESLKLSCIKAGFSDVSLKPCYIFSALWSYKESLRISWGEEHKTSKFLLIFESVIRAIKPTLISMLFRSAGEEIILTAKKYPE